MTATIRMAVDAAPAVTGTITITALGPVITLTNLDNTGILGWQWTMVDRPASSVATISNPLTNTANFTPDVEGTYLIRLQTYTDVGRTILDDTDEQGCGVLFAVPYDWRIPSAGEVAQFGARGWAGAVNEILRETRTGLLGATGDVVGPGSATDNALARYDSTTGKLLQDSQVTVGDAGEVENVDHISLDERGSDPAAVGNTGKTYTKDVGGLTEFFYRDSAGNVTQLTTAGVVNSPTQERYEFVFDPDAVQAGNVYSNWTTMMSALTAEDGLKTLYVRLPSTSPSISESASNLEGVIIIGRPEDRAAGRTITFTTASTAWSKPPVYIENLRLTKTSGILVDSSVNEQSIVRNCTLTANNSTLFKASGTGVHDVHVYGDTSFASVSAGNFVNADASATGNVYAHDAAVSFGDNFAGGTANRVNLFYGPGVTVDSTAVSYVKRQLGWEAISPTQLTADVNDYEPTGWSSARFVRLSADALRTITGFSADVIEPFKYWINTSANTITLSFMDAASTAVNRIRTHTGADVELAQYEGVLGYYDATSLVWRTIALNPTVGDVVGPGSAVNEAVAVFNTTTGKLIKEVPVTIDASGDVRQVTTVQFNETTTPALAANKGSVYTKDISGRTELFYVDSAGTETQITNVGIIGTGPGIPGIRPTALSGNTDNYAPAAWSGAQPIILLSSSAGNVDLTGLVPASVIDGHVVYLANADDTDTITLKHDVTSTATNRFSMTDSADLALAPGEFIEAMRDVTKDRWIIKPSGGGTATDADAIHDNAANEITAVTAKTTPASADELLMEDSAAGFVKKAITAGNLLNNTLVNDQAAVHTDGAGEIAALTLVTAAAGDHILVEDASDSNNKKRVAASDFLGGGGGTQQQEAVTTETITGTDTALSDTLNNTPTSNASLKLFFNGVLAIQGAGNDYTVSGTTITWLASSGTAPDMDTSDTLTAVYES